MVRIPCRKHFIDVAQDLYFSDVCERETYGLLFVRDYNSIAQESAGWDT
jgi:hypothetical protein